MTQAAVRIDGPPALTSLLERDLEPGGLSAALGIDADVPLRLWDRALAAPLRALASRGGKEFRGELLSIAWELAGGRGEAPPELAGIIEGLHLGSLIVDDIEDGSTRRRGGPALHHEVGLPLALNAGNWLYFWPTLLVSRLSLAAETELLLRQAIDHAVLRCHFGQGLDLSVRVTELAQNEVQGVVSAATRLKTGSLMELSARLGAIAAGGDPTTVRVLGSAASELGVALQMLDDLTGLTSEKRCHKGHEDLIHARPTWPWAWLAGHSDGDRYESLRALGDQVAARDVHPEVLAANVREALGERGRDAVQRRAYGGLAALAHAFGERRGLARLRHWLKRLEQYDG